MLTKNNWPPTYQLRRSSRAKYVSLKVCPYRGLQVVIPTRCSEVEAKRFLEQKKDWVLNQLAHFTPKEIVEIPTQLDLKALGQVWFIRQEIIEGLKKQKLLILPNELVLSGNQNQLADKKATFAILKNWLYLIAEKELLILMRQLSDELQLPYEKLSIRNQISRWGSCNSAKHISLNVKLLFLPKHLVEYVMVHELCHTRHLNHSQAFWSLLERFLPNYQDSIRELKLFQKQIPHWLYQMT